MQIIKFYDLRLSAEDLLSCTGDTDHLAMASDLVTKISDMFNPSRDYGHDISNKNLC